MRPNIPSSIANTSHDLSVEALVRLFEIKLTNNSLFRLSPYGNITWKGQLYEEVPIQMSGLDQDGSGRLARPKLTFANPGGMFTASVHLGLLDNALVTRYRILRSDLDANRDFALRETFRLSRIVTLQKSIIVAELRDVLDGHYFEVPGRRFQPPEFPFVQLS